MKRLTSYTILGDDLNFVVVDGKSVKECFEWQKELKLLAAYEELGVSPEQLHEFSSIYLEKCEEVNRLSAELEEYKKNNIPPEVVAEYKKFEDELVSKSITFNHVLELIKAEEDLSSMYEESITFKEFLETYMDVVNQRNGSKCNKIRILTDGTVDDYEKLKDKMKAKAPIRLDNCTCPNCGTYNEAVKKRRNTVTYDTVHCWHCGQAIEVKRLESEPNE